MKRTCIAAACLLMTVSYLSSYAADWYDPEGWLDRDEAVIQNEWWSDGLAENGVGGPDYMIYGYDSPATDREWGYGYDYNTVDWYEFEDPFTKWYEKNSEGWL